MRLTIPPDATFPRLDRIMTSVRSRVIGQDNAIKEIAAAFHRAFAHLQFTGRPAAVLLFAGPTGVGKTLAAKALADAFKEAKFIKVDCGDFAGDMSHAVMKLLGAPPSFVGHGGKVVFSSENFNKGATILLFDEIEKALGGRDGEFLGLLVSALDSGTVTNNRNEVISLENTIIILTSNLGTKQVVQEVVGQGLGFKKSDHHIKMAEMDDQEIDEVNSKIETVVLKAVKLALPPEIFNRIDRTVVFRYLTEREHLTIIDVELGLVQEQINEAAAKGEVPPITIRVTDPAKKLVLQEIRSEREYGARALKRAVEKLIVTPLAELVNYGQIPAGSAVEVRRENGNLSFWID